MAQGCDGVAEIIDGFARLHIGYDVASYRLFLQAKALPRFRLRGCVAEFPAEYLGRLGLARAEAASASYTAPDWMFDYQRAVSALAIRKRRFACFMGCGLGKTLVLLEFARHAAEQLGEGRCVLVVAPLMVVPQTLQEAGRFYGDSLSIRQVRADELQRFLDSPDRTIGVTNYEAIREGLRPGKLGGLIPDESSSMKSHYGAWGLRLIELGRGLEWKLALTGTPAPNDRIEFANHAVFLDQSSTVNSFLARYFVNKGQTGERWELKPHALRVFYRDLSHWSIFLNDPATYGWRDNVGAIPPIRVHIHDVPLTREQLDCLPRGDGLFGNEGVVTPAGGQGMSGMVGRGVLAQLAKGRFQGRRVETAKPGYIKGLVDSWKASESTIVWCRFNDEQEQVHGALEGSASVAGDTGEEDRRLIVQAFQDGEIRTIVTKGKILGFGLNLQVATRQVFSTCHDSYEEWWQCVKRSNRVGSVKPLDVHIPVTEIERPMMENVLRKADRVEADTREQESLFKENRPSW